MAITPGPPEDRFFSFIDRRDDGCWVWQGNLGWQGYGQFWVNGKTVRAHRWAYERWVGPIGSGLQIDHLCRVRNCVNPSHLEPVTPRENVMRGTTTARINSEKTHCARANHPLDGANLYISPKGSRECRRCRTEAVRRSVANRRLSTVGAE